MLEGQYPLEGPRYARGYRVDHFAIHQAEE
jgi:hypothetical protein